MALASRVRRPARTLLAAAALVLGAAPVALVAGPAEAATGGDCSTTGTTRTCTFASTGAEQTFVVPAGVTTVSVVAIGGAGGEGFGSDGWPGGGGGRGARVTGSLSVSPDDVLYVEVGGSAGSGGCALSIACRGGFNGGGSSGGSSASGGGGGGASDVRTVSRSDAASLDSRVLVAGGGGGGGTGVPTRAGGGRGGDAAQSGANGTNASQAPGGAPGVNDDGTGRAGRDDSGGAGGGGAKGGAGGGSAMGGPDPDNWSAGGGGGSNLVPDGGSASPTGAGPGVTISWSVGQVTLTGKALNAQPGQNFGHDVEIVGGASPTGRLTWRMYADAACTDLLFTGQAQAEGIRNFTAIAQPRPVGRYWWTVSYSGDDGGTPASIPCGTPGNVSTVGTATTLDLEGPNQVTRGDEATFTATVGATSGTTTPTGSVDFTVDGDPVDGCTAAPVIDGVATCTTDDLPLGESVSVDAAFTSDSTFLPSKDDAIVTVVRATTTTLTTFPTGTLDPGTPVTLTATVDVDADTPPRMRAGARLAPPAFGQVEFTRNGAAVAGCGSVDLDADGEATCVVRGLRSGTHRFTATYVGGSESYGSSEADAVVRIAGVVPDADPSDPSDTSGATAVSAGLPGVGSSVSLFLIGFGGSTLLGGAVLLAAGRRGRS